MGIDLYFYGGPGCEAHGSYQFFQQNIAFNHAVLAPFCKISANIGGGGETIFPPPSPNIGGGGRARPRFLRPCLRSFDHHHSKNRDMYSYVYIARLSLKFPYMHEIMLLSNEMI